MLGKFAVKFVPGLLAGAVGGYLGYLAVWWVMTNSAFWVPILPGAFAGLACGQVSPVASRVRGAINGLIGLGLAIYAQWRLFNPPFEFDGTFAGYLAHLPKLPTMTLVVLALNGILAAYWGREQRIGGSRRAKPDRPPEV